MEKIKDNIYDAYYSKKGEEFGKKVRERIHWITQHVSGNEILDVGCSQGITAILLGREGKKVLGLDLSNSAIEDAKKNLSIEEEETRSCITFERNNFFLKQFEDDYDTVILGEVLEHITDLDTFFTKAIELTREDGRIIVTTPFGINEFIDHKRTFYIRDLINLQNENIYIEEIKFFGKWIGIIYKKKENKSNLKIDDSLLFDFEQAIYKVEEKYLKELNYLSKKANKVTNTNKQEQDETSNNQLYLDEKVEKVHIQKELVDAYGKIEALIEKNKKTLRDYEALLTRYQNLRNSKFGRIATKYWKYRNKKRGK